MKKYLKDLVPLVAICLVAALLLAVFNMVTEDPIAENTLRAAQETRTRLLPEASTFEAVALEDGSAVDSCYQGFNAKGESVGYVVETTVGGYGGEIVVTVGMAADNTITGINVGGENFSETAGLGALAKEEAFTSQYVGEKAPLQLQKGESGLQDGIIDAISGATITSTAVNGGVNSAAKFVMDLAGGGASANTASVQGFAGPVAVTLSLDESGAIREISIGDDFFNETEGFGRRALEESFQAQFIGKVPPLTLSDIDALSGATITSTAVVDAVNQVYAQLFGTTDAAVAVIGGADGPTAIFLTSNEQKAPDASDELTATVPAAGENALTGSAQGFAGAVAVKVDLDENGKISAITIGDDSFAETPGLGAKALEDAFKAQFIGKILPLTAENVDMIAGATITSNAVIEALNAAGGQTAEPSATEEPAAAATMAMEEKKAGFVVEREVKKNEAEEIKEEAGFRVERDVKAPAAVSSVAVSSAAVLTGSAQGFAGPVTVEITLENGAIAAITIGDDQFAETPGLGARAQEEAFQSQFIGKTLPVAAEEIDAIASATITTNAVIEAVNAAQ